MSLLHSFKREASLSGGDTGMSLLHSFKREASYLGRYRHVAASQLQKGSQLSGDCGVSSKKLCVTREILIKGVQL